MPRIRETRASEPICNERVPLALVFRAASGAVPRRWGVDPNPPTGPWNQETGFARIGERDEHELHCSQGPITCLPSTATEQTTWNPGFRPGPPGSGRDSAWSCLPWPWRRPPPPRESPSPRSTLLRRPRRRSTPGAATSEGSLPSIRASPLMRPPGRRPRHPDECGPGSFDSVETTTRPPERRPGRRRCRSRSIVRSCRDPGGTPAGYSHPGSSWISTVTSKPACAT